MIQRPFSNEMSAREPTDTRWCYWHPALDGVVEMGTLRGNEVSLPAHFHRENQITFVISGRRRFILGREVMTLLPGQDALIAAGVVHRFLSEPSGTDCLNVYVPAGEYNVAAMVRDAEHVWSKLRG